MRIIIIGSKGFIGQSLFNYLKDKGHDVWGADVVSDYLNEVKYFHICVTNPDFSAVFKHIQYNTCINCSGSASVSESMKNPLRDYFLNTINVIKLLDAIKDFQPDCSFINLSSAAVYGNPKQLPIRETDSTCPISPYGIHKLQAEQLCKEYYEFFKIKTCSIRIFSAYGPGLRKQLFWDLYNKVNTGLPFKLFGTGNESRDFIYILDLVKAIEVIAKTSDFKADIINVANGQEIKIKDAVSIFFDFFPYEIMYSFTNEIRIGDPSNWMADISKLLSKGYQTSVYISDGLKEYFDWINEDNV